MVSLPLVGSGDLNPYQIAYNVIPQMSLPLVGSVD